MTDYPGHEPGDDYYASSRDDIKPQWIQDAIRLTNELLNTVQTAATSRELSVAKTNIEQGLMWILKHHAKRGRQ